MSISEREIAIVDEIIELAWNQGDLDVVDEHVSSDYSFQNPLFDETPRGPEGFKKLIQGFRQGLPDLRMEVKNRVVGDDVFVDRIVVTGTHEGNLMGLEPTGKSVEVTSLTEHHFSDGKFVADIGVADFLGMFEQLGVIESIPLEM